MAALDMELLKIKRQSGTLDLYDESSDRVRNLRLIRQQNDMIERDGAYYISLDYRDIQEGDQVTVEAELRPADGDYAVAAFTIKDVRVLDRAAQETDRDYTDMEVQDFMRDYLEKQTQFNDGKLMLFDKDAGKMRSLELIMINEEVRRLGIYMSSSSQFNDVDSGEMVEIDISVENKKGRLNVQALRIRNVRNGPSGQ
jgi:hypothetical protein